MTSVDTATRWSLWIIDNSTSHLQNIRQFLLSITHHVALKQSVVNYLHAHIVYTTRAMHLHRSRPYILV